MRKLLLYKEFLRNFAQFLQKLRCFLGFCFGLTAADNALRGFYRQQKL